jgi:two-component system, OmpR family, response regulator
MKNESPVKVFLVDDDALFLKMLEIEFLGAGEYEVKTFKTGELCLEHIAENPDVVILDYNLNGIDKDAMNGLLTLDKIKEINPGLPVIMLSSQDSIDVAVNCMHHHAFDYVVKSETAFIRLQKIIASVLNFRRLEKQLSWYMEKM